MMDRVYLPMSQCRRIYRHWARLAGCSNSAEMGRDAARTEIELRSEIVFLKAEIDAIRNRTVARSTAGWVLTYE